MTHMSKNFKIFTPPSQRREDNLGGGVKLAPSSPRGEEVFDIGADNARGKMEPAKSQNFEQKR